MNINGLTLPISNETQDLFLMGFTENALNNVRISIDTLAEAIGGGEVEEAPIDGQDYVRNNASWTVASGASTGNYTFTTDFLNNGGSVVIESNGSSTTKFGSSLLTTSLHGLGTIQMPAIDIAAINAGVPRSVISKEWALQEFMDISTYTSGGSSVYSMDNMIEGANTKIFTASERTKLTNLPAGAEANRPMDVETWNPGTGSYSPILTNAAHILILADTSAAAYGVTINDGAFDGQRITIIDPSSTWGTNNLTLSWNLYNANYPPIGAISTNGAHISVVWVTGLGWTLYSEGQA